MFSVAGLSLSNFGNDHKVEYIGTIWKGESLVLMKNNISQYSTKD